MYMYETRMDSTSTTEYKIIFTTIEVRGAIYFLKIWLRVPRTHARGTPGTCWLMRGSDAHATQRSSILNLVLNLVRVCVY
jgi:hypothetical protein